MNALNKLTPAQWRAIENFEAAMPPGYTFALHVGASVWGATIFDPDGESVGHVQRLSGGILAHCDPTDRHAKKLVNKVSAALWHRQPRW